MHIFLSWIALVWSFVFYADYERFSYIRVFQDIDCIIEILFFLSVVTLTKSQSVFVRSMHVFFLSFLSFFLC